MTGSRRSGKLEDLVLLSVLFVAVQLDNWIPDLEKSAFYLPVALLTAKGVYEIILRSVRFVILHSSVLMRLYWGRLYLAGYWSYEYTRGGITFFGIWRFEQDLDDVRIVGGGLNNEFRPRTIVRSVSPLIEDQGAYFVLNVRSELDQATGHILPVYSKTTLILDTPRRFFREVITLRATTEVYGGPSTGQLHPDVVFHKHPGAYSDEDVVNELRESGRYSGNAEPT